ncbi:unnamed protein product [Cylicocyclus nassatus]|uniref:Uncharacterized protein n=1 Tax=Cylicocyclus nassatus TaxID=53992 RepID=A0AA36H273_CYLNA|nr:unnamed protein product [Cylicocyclus nassatus]
MYLNHDRFGAEHPSVVQCHFVHYKHSVPLVQFLSEYAEISTDLRVDNQMFRLSLAVLVLSECALSMPPPAGLNLKPAKAIGEEHPNVPLSNAPAEVSKEPPNLRLRSRMMAALNAVNETSKKELVPLGSQTLILTKNRKYKKPSSSRSFFGAVTEEPITAAPLAVRPAPKTLPSSANYGVNPVLQTNFVDAQGRVLKNVVSIPIRVGEAKIKAVSAASVSLVEGEAENGVHVKFGQASPAPI